MVRQVGHDRLEFPNGVAYSRGHGFPGPFCGVVGELAGTPLYVSGAPQLVKQRVALRFEACDAAVVVVASGFIGFALNVGESFPVDVERLSIGDGTWAARAVCRVDEVEHVDVSAWGSEEPDDVG